MNFPNNWIVNWTFVVYQEERGGSVRTCGRKKSSAPSSSGSTTVNFSYTAASKVSGLKMRTLLLGVILGLLAVVHSTPVNTVTQIPAKAEDEVFREAATDGFLVDNFLSTPSAPESPETNTTVQASQQPTSDSKESDAIEGSGSEASDKSTTPVSLQFGTTTVSHATVLPRGTDDSSSDSSTTQSLQSSSTSVPNEAQPSVTPDHISASQTTDPAVSTFDFLTTLSSDSGSGFQSNDVYFMTSSSNSETSATSSTSMAAPGMFATSEGSGSGSGSGSGEGLSYEAKITAITEIEQRSNVLNIGTPNKIGANMPAQSKAGGTQGWMIIVGFIVGLAALVMLLVAIATRDKWNGPSKASKVEDKSNSSNQQRELEMETFLRKDNPRENGHAGEYTVIPLEELSENHSSH